jgi:PII-like signaling protein
MNDDIVTRLRNKYQGQLPIMLEAADEIERLRKVIEEISRERDRWMSQTF